MSHEKVATLTHIGSKVPDEIAYPLIIKRLWLRTAITETGCWQSSHSTNGTGYIQVFFRGKRVFIHRVSYEAHKGPIPEGLYVLHTCDNRRCWNPDHLWLGTISDNKQDEIRKGRNYEANRTHCPRGHAYAEHGIEWPSRPGWRHCRICQRAQQRIASGWPEDLAYSAPRGARLGVRR